MARLTAKYIKKQRALAADIEREVVCFDETLPGFGVRIKPGGSTTWLTQYRNQTGASRRVKLGAYEVLGPEAARKEAKKY